MHTDAAFTPFGRRPMTLAHVATQLAAKAVEPTAIVHKWHVFEAVREARQLLGATDRALAILHALLSFHPETALSGPDGLIVWPSNEQLAARANGMPPTTLRRHLAVLVDCGLIIRRDSPNGKRFCRKGRDGAIEQAFGFDLSPLVARAEEIRALADTVQDDKRALRRAKQRVSLLRRDIAKMIETGIMESVPGDWCLHQETYQVIIARQPRSPSAEALDVLIRELEPLHAELRSLLETCAKTQNMDANDDQIGRQIQATAEPSSVICKNDRRRPFGRQNSSSAFGDFASGEEALPDFGGSQPPKPASGPNVQAEMLHISLSLVRSACPDIVHMLPEAFGSWSELRRSAQSLCRLAYINPQVWEEARSQLGPDVAICALVMTVQRNWAGGISKTAGGYMRELTQRGLRGELNLAKSLFGMAKSAIGGSQ
ncbi:plasmid replication protein RepC [Xanthobacter sp. V13C-7B]|uniref:plasmid replication protein RepC n=1 Tax=Xanthobacter variabilis TaxID=3119932 RepID=UPI00372A021F